MRICHLFLAGCSILILAGCGQKQPIGYEIVKERAGDIKTASGMFGARAFVPDTFNCMSGASCLYAGNKENFEAKTFIYFYTKKDSVALNPESLYVVGKDSGKVYIYRVFGTPSMDSLVWSNAPTVTLMDSMELIKDSAVGICIDSLAADTGFYFALFGASSEMTGIYNVYEGNRAWFTTEEDTSKKYYPTKATYIDTSYYSADSLGDSLMMLQTGGYVTKCSTYIKVEFERMDVCVIVEDDTTADIKNAPADSVIKKGTIDHKQDACDTISAKDTMWAVKDTTIDTVAVPVDSLTDSLRSVWKLDSATVNKAILTMRIDTGKSYNWTSKKIKLKYKDYSSFAYIAGDSVVLTIPAIIGEWFKKGYKLGAMISSEGSDISRIIIKPDLKLDITYTLPGKNKINIK
ncbi:MAG: hypothetical protein PHX21_00510 [bacterium]|nr:hypothetical protein [bacterium]